MSSQDERLREKKYRPLHVAQSLDTRCPICRFFLGIIQEDYGDCQWAAKICSAHVVVTSSSDYVFGWLELNLPKVKIGWRDSIGYEVATRTISWQKSEERIVHPIGSYTIDYDAIKVAIVLCKETHLSCRQLRSNSNLYLKLIDCETREVILASSRPPEDYAALSYVWGSSKHDVKHLALLPLHLPATIEDAIQVVLKLGFRYLWIDRYCID